MGVGRVAEFGWALGLEPHFELRKPNVQDGQNANVPHIEDSRSVAPVEINIEYLNAALKHSPLAA
jgi:hypothetical protein